MAKAKSGFYRGYNLKMEIYFMYKGCQNAYSMLMIWWQNASAVRKPQKSFTFINTLMKNCSIVLTSDDSVNMMEWISVANV